MATDIPISEFLGEAEDIIDSLNRDLLALSDALTQKRRPNPSLINNIFRAAHSLKGISGLFGFTELTTLSHSLENTLDRLRMGKINLSERVMDLLFASTEMLRTIVASKAKGGSPPSSRDLETLIERLEHAGEEKGELLSDDAALCVGRDILAVLTEYEEHRLQENLREGMNIIKLRTAFDLATFDESLTELQNTTRNFAEIITTLPSADESSEEKITFDLIIGTDYSFDEVEELLAGRSLSFQLLRAGTATPPPAVAAPTAPAGPPPPENIPPPSEEPPSVPPPVRRQALPGEENISNEAVSSLKTLSQTVRVDIAKLDNLMNIVGELVIAKNILTQLVERLRNMVGINELVMEFIKNSRSLERKLSELQSGVLEVRMVPIGQIFDKLHRNVRKLSRELGKDIEFIAEGGDTELDKLIIEDLADPLMHIIRNSISHGIEPKAERIQLGKPERGLIQLRAFQRGNHVVIEIFDDGAGFNYEKIRRKAVERGLLDPAAEPRPEELIEFLFYPGFSTAEQVSEISGRGVGLDVVKANISALSGAIDIESRPGEGTKFIITLPITLAIIQALIVESASETFAIPLNSVQQGLMIKPHQIQTIEGREVIELRGKTLPLLRLDRLFGLSCPASGPGGNGSNARGEVKEEAAALRETAASEDEEIYVVKVGIAERGLGIIVDKLWGRQDIVIKSVGEILKGIKGIAGATELGNQRTILVLDVLDLMEEAAVSSVSALR